MNKIFLTFITSLLLMSLSFSCAEKNNDNDLYKLSSERKILSIEHENLVKVEFLMNHMEIKIDDYRVVSMVSLTWKAGTDLTEVDPIIRIPRGATLFPSSLERDFSKQMEYTVVPEDGSTGLTYIISSTTED